MPRKIKKVELPPASVAESNLGEPYFVSIRIDDVKFEESGTTIPEALMKFKIEKLLGKPILGVRHGEKEYKWLGKPLFVKKTLEFPQHKLLFEKRAKQFLGEL